MTDRDLFIAALDHPDPADRAAWLERACADDPGRKHRVEVLLKAHDDASRFLAGPAPAPGDSIAPDDPTRTASPADETSPAQGVDVLSFLKPADKPGLLGKLDHYEVIEVVGKGGMGVVLKAFDPKLHRLVALKLMAPHLAAHGGARKRFEREAKAVAAVRNEHVVAIHGVETDGPVPYLVMEFVGGVSLQDRLDRRGPAEVKEVLRIGMQAALGLAAAHKVGIIHRDIKPANILLENGVERVKITDFGLARAADDATLTQSGVITGTPNYMSPEQAAGTPVGARSDLFSLGSVLYALCTGHPPFRAETPLAVLRRVCDDPVRPPREANPDVPDWLDAIVRKLLAKDPADRFQSADEVAELLGQHLAHLQQPATVPMPAPVAVAGAGERVWRQIFEATDRDRRLWQHGMIVTGLVLIGLAAAVGIPSGSYLILFAPAVIGLALIAVGGFERQQWDVPYKGRTIRFENSPFAGERLFVDGVRIARGGFGFMRELRGTIPDGPGAGDEVRALCEAGFLRFGCRISVSQGRPKPPAPAPAPVVPTAAPAAGPAERPRGAGLGCLLAPLALVGLVLFRDTLYQFYRSVYFAPFDMGLSVWFGLTLIRAGRRTASSAGNRRLWDLAWVVLIGGTLISLVVWWHDLVDHREHPEWKDWHFPTLLLSLLIGEAALIPWLLARQRARLAAAPPADEPPAPPPARPPGPTGVGWLALIGVVAVLGLLFKMQESFWHGYFRPGYTAPLDMIVTSGVLLAILWWCRRQSEPGWYRRALGVAMAAVTGGTLMGLLSSWGEGSYLDKLGGAQAWDNGGIFVALAIILASVGIRVARWVAWGPAPRPARAAVAVAAAVGIAGAGVACWAVATGRLARELQPDPDPETGYLRVVKDDPDAEVIVERPGDRLIQSAPGGRSVQGVRVPPDVAYTLSVHKAAMEVHHEVIRLKAGDRREIDIPPIASPERTVWLVPKAGSFPSDVTRMEFSPDRSAVAVERFDGPILVFDAATGKERFRIDRPKTHCPAFGFTPDGRRLAYLAPDGPVDHVLRVVDVGDGHPIGKDIKPQPDHPFSNSHALAYSPDGKRLAVSSAHNADRDSRWESRILRWEPPADGSAPRELEPLQWQDGTIEELRFTPNGSRVLAVAGTHTWTAWDWETGKPGRRNEAEVDFAYDRVAAGGPVEAVAGWGELTHQANALLSQRRPDGLVFMSARDAGPLRYGCLAVSADGKLAAGGVKGSVAAGWNQQPAVRVWDTGSQNQRAILVGHADWPLAIAFDPDGKGVLTAGKDGTVRHWKLP